jgi:hypothetical protein
VVVSELTCHWVRFLKCHPILCCLHWHGDEGIQEAGGHGSTKDIWEVSGDPKRSVSCFKLVVCSWS